MFASILGFLERIGKKIGLDLRYFATSSSYTVSTQAILIIVSFLSSIVLTSYLAKDDYGTYLLVLSILAILGIFCIAGMNLAILHAVGEGKYGAYFQGIRYSTIGFFLSLIGLLGTVAYFIFLDHWLLVTLLLLSTPYLYTNYVMGWYYFFFVGIKRFDTGSKYFLFIRVSSIVATMVTAYLTRNIVYTLLALVLVHGITTLIVHWYVVRFIRASKKGHKEDKGLLKYAIKLTTNSSFVQMLLENIDKPLIAYFLGLREVAIYGVALILPMALQGLMKAVLNTAAPKFAKELKKMSSAVLLKKIILLFLLLIVPLALFSVIVRFILPIFYPTYMESIPYAVYLVFLLILYFPQGVVRYLLVFRKLTKKLFQVEVLSGIFYLLALVFFLKPYGVMGIVFSLFIYRFSLVLCGFLLLHHEQTA